MFNSLKARMIFPIMIVLVLLVLFMVVFVGFSTRNLADTLTEERIEAVSSSVLAYLALTEDLNEMNTRVISQSQQLVWFVRSWNAGVGTPDQHRTALFQYLTSRKNDIDVTSFVVTDSSGNMLMRTHEYTNIDRFGDTGFVADTIYAAHHTGRVSTIYSSTPAMAMGLSSAAPIRDVDGSIIGTVGGVVDFDLVGFADYIAQSFNAEVSIYSRDFSATEPTFRIASTTLRDESGNLLTGTLADDAMVQQVINNGQRVRTEMTIHNTPFHAYFFPLEGWGGTPAGMMFVGFSNELTVNATNALQLILFAIGVIGLAVAIGVTLLVMLKQLSPLSGLTNDAREVAKGNTAINFRTQRKDEIGQVSNAFASVVRSLRILTETIEKGEKAINHGDLAYKLKDERLEGAFDEILNMTNVALNSSNAVFEMITEPILLIDRNMNLLFANKAIRQHVGESKDYYGMNIDTFLNSNLSSNSALRNAFATGKSELEVEIQLQLTPQKLFDMQMSCIPFKAGGSEIVGMVLLLNDTTHIVHMQRLAEKRGAYR